MRRPKPSVVVGATNQTKLVEQRIDRLATIVDQLPLAQARRNIGSPCRTARVVTSGTHPTTGQVFEIEFENGDYPITAGGVPFYIPKHPTRNWCCNVINFIPPVDSHVLVWYIDGQWWTKCSQVESNPDPVKVLGTEGHTIVHDPDALNEAIYFEPGTIFGTAGERTRSFLEAFPGHYAHSGVVDFQIPTSYSSYSSLILEFRKGANGAHAATMNIDVNIHSAPDSPFVIFSGDDVAAVIPADMSTSFTWDTSDATNTVYATVDITSLFPRTAPERCRLWFRENPITHSDPIQQRIAGTPVYLCLIT